MEKYQIIEEIGSGTYGVVSKALNKETNKVVAIKKLKQKYSSYEECMNLREVKSLLKMNKHPNVVKLNKIVQENDTLFMVFEYMESDLHKLIDNRTTPFSESEIRDMCFQLFQGLDYMHRNGYFHRDLKPMNLLVNKDVIKIGDFGLARDTNDQPPYTEYVTTRAYRAPEVLLYSRVYNSKVDMWAMGVIMAELFTLKPLFHGPSAISVVSNICRVLGTPTESTWSEGLVQASEINYRFPEFLGMQFSELLPNAGSDAVNLIATLLSWDPCMRPTAMEALQHSFFDDCYHVPPPLRHEPPILTAALIKGAILFKMTMQRELLKQASLKFCTTDSAI